MKFEYVCALLLSTFAFILLRVNGDRKFGLELRYATSIVEVSAPNSTDHQNNTVLNKNSICHLSPEDQHQICEDVVNTRYCQRNGFIMFGHKRGVEPEKYYEITYGGFYNYGIPPQIGPACMCPSLPPLYLKDGSVPGVVTVVIDGETASALENSIR